jgi:Activator of Hsp90 ATPase homolog 1-like protein
VTFDIEPLGQQVKLTVMHDGFEPGSAGRETISGGWPVVLANLKTLLETGATLPDTSTPDRMAGGAVRE